MIHFDMPPQKSSIIKVLGFGGGGGNAVNHMYKQQIQNVDFIVCNTDAQALTNSDVPNKIQLGPHLTQGLGAGANPNIGKQATEESLEEIRRMLEVNTKMAFITAGMGGGTGTGGAPTVAKICKELGVLTVGIVTTPFAFEGPKRMAQAQAGINELKECVDTLLVISNDKLRQQYGNLKMKEAFAKADDVLSTAARCITDVINTTGQINVDFADVCTVMRNGGVAILGNAQAAGEDRALTAIQAAINSPLLNDNDISGAKWILLNIISAEGEFEYTMDEVESIQQFVRQQTGESTDVILGMGYDNTMGDKISITIIATGFRHKDPFEKPTQVKATPKLEPMIVMTLGVEGEEQKMYAQPNTNTPAELPVMMPLITEENPNFTAQNLREELITIPAPEIETNTINAALEIKEEVIENPVYFELDVNPPAEAETTVPISFEPTVMPVNAKELPAEIVVNAAGFLNKPAQIYHEQKADKATPFLTEEIEAAKPTIEELNEVSWMPVMSEQLTEDEEAVAGISLSFDDRKLEPKQQGVLFEQKETGQDLSEEEEQKRRAQERINRLRNLSFNPLHIDNSSEFENVPAYLRRNLELHNSIANVEDFYSRAQVKPEEDNQASISTLNNFLHGDKPD